MFGVLYFEKKRVKHQEISDIIIIKVKGILVLLTLASTLYNCQNNKDKHLIIEDKGVDVFKLGVNIDKSPKVIDGISLLVNRDSLVHAIDINSTAYYTKDGLRVGVNYQTVLEQRGMYDTTKFINKANPTNGKQNKLPHSMRYNGIIFFLDNEGIVEKIRIY